MSDELPALRERALHVAGLLRPAGRDAPADLLTEAAALLRALAAPAVAQELAQWQERQARRVHPDGRVIEWSRWYPCSDRDPTAPRAIVLDAIPYEWRPVYLHPAPAAAQEPVLGDNKFESWYESYVPQGGDKQRARDAYAAGMADPRSISATAPQDGRAVPEGWAIERGAGWVSVRNLESSLGQDFYPDRDPLIFAFLRALDAPTAPEAAQAERSCGTCEHAASPVDAAPCRSCEYHNKWTAPSAAPEPPAMSAAVPFVEISHQHVPGGELWLMHMGADGYIVPLGATGPIRMPAGWAAEYAKARAALAGGKEATP